MKAIRWILIMHTHVHKETARDERKQIYKKIPISLNTKKSERVKHTHTHTKKENLCAAFFSTQ